LEATYQGTDRDDGAHPESLTEHCKMRMNSWKGNVT
jgi:hypothetical protein